MSQDRATFQELARARFAEANLLLESGFPSGAYYLAGYAIECELKAFIAAVFRANEIPGKSRFWTPDAAATMLEAVGAADKGLPQWLRKR
jgi:hypothetical protein